MRVSGIFTAKENEDGSFGQIYAKFRKRITFPIMNEQGRVIAFTARALDETDDKGRTVAEVHELARDAALYQGTGALQP